MYTFRPRGPYGARRVSCELLDCRWKAFICIFLLVNHMSNEVHTGGRRHESTSIL